MPRRLPVSAVAVPGAVGATEHRSNTPTPKKPTRSERVTPRPPPRVHTIVQPQTSRPTSHNTDLSTHPPPQGGENADEDQETEEPRQPRVCTMHNRPRFPIHGIRIHACAQPQGGKRTTAKDPDETWDDAITEPEQSTTNSNNAPRIFGALVRD
jgi:hypothetical protein